MNNENIIIEHHPHKTPCRLSAAAAAAATDNGGDKVVGAGPADGLIISTFNNGSPQRDDLLAHNLFARHFHKNAASSTDKFLLNYVRRIPFQWQLYDDTDECHPQLICDTKEPVFSAHVPNGSELRHTYMQGLGHMPMGCRRTGFSTIQNNCSSIESSISPSSSHPPSLTRWLGSSQPASPLQGACQTECVRVWILVQVFVKDRDAGEMPWKCLLDGHKQWPTSWNRLSSRASLCTTGWRRSVIKLMIN